VQNNQYAVQKLEYTIKGENKLLQESSGKFKFPIMRHLVLARFVKALSVECYNVLMHRHIRDEQKVPLVKITSGFLLHCNFMYELDFFVERMLGLCYNSYFVFAVETRETLLQAYGSCLLCFFSLIVPETKKNGHNIHF